MHAIVFFMTMILVNLFHVVITQALEPFTKKKNVNILLEIRVMGIVIFIHHSTCLHYSLPDKVE